MFNASLLGGKKKRLIQQMNARHPFLDKAFLWFSPKDFFFLDKIPDAKLSLRWDRLPRIRRVAPIGRIIDPDSCVPPKKVPVNPVYLPSMRTIVRTLCPNMSQLVVPVPVPSLPSPSPPPPAPTRPVADRGKGRGDDVGVVATNTSRVFLGPFPMEEIDIGDDVEIDWDWWESESKYMSLYLLR